MNVFWKFMAWVVVIALVVGLGWAIILTFVWIGTLDGPVIGTIATAIAGIIGLLYTQWHSKTREIAEKHRPKKIEVYDTFLDIIDMVINNTRMANSGRLDFDEILDDLREKFSALTRGMIVWASPAVI